MWNMVPTQLSGRHARGAASALLALSCAVAIAACGSSTQSTSTVSSTQGLKFADCMRAHGVPNFPDPITGGGLQFRPGSGIDPSSPAFQAAQSACSKLLPGGPPARHGPPSAQAEKQMLTISECMRAHGVTGFPDPTTNPPSSIRGYSLVLGRGGVFLAVPDTINTGSPAYTTAAAACRFGAPRTAKTAAAF
jgi:hypothetical protein